MNRIDRLIAILTTLQSKKYATAEFIADKYEISLRTVYRDLKALGEIGVPIYFENQKAYSILKSFFLPPVSLTTDEANSLILVSTLSEKFGDKTTKNNIESAIGKIKAVLRSTDKDKIDLLHSQIKIYKAPDEPEKKDFLTDIQNAIINKEVLRIEYINNNEEKSLREIEPIGLTFYSNQWHLIAWCWMRNSYRDFKVARIVDLKNLKEKFRKPKHYDINEYIKSLS